MPAPSLDGTTVLSEPLAGGIGLTFASQKTTAGSNRIGFVALGGQSFGGAGGVTATWNGVAMTKVDEIGAGGIWAVLFYILNPPTSASTVVASAGAALFGLASCFSMQDADVTGTPLGTPATNASESLTVSSAVGETVIDIIGVYNSSVSVGAGQTQIASQSDSGIFGFASYEAGASSVVMDWTTSIAYGHVGVSVKPAAGGGGAAFIPRPNRMVSQAVNRAATY